MSSSKNVAILWDYENCAIPATEPCYAVVNNIRKIAHAFGTVVTFNAYFEWPEHLSPKSQALRAELAMCGVSLIDCPHNGRKDVADKMILADMMAFVLDNSPPATVILISGDVDFVYAVSKLRLRRYHVVLFAPPVAASALRAQASVAYEWPGTVLPPLNLKQPRTRAADFSTPKPISRTARGDYSDSVPATANARITSRHPSPAVSPRMNANEVNGPIEDTRGRPAPSRTPETPLNSDDTVEGDVLGDGFVVQEPDPPSSPVVNDESLTPLVTALNSPQIDDASATEAPLYRDNPILEDAFSAFLRTTVASGGPIASTDFQWATYQEHPSRLSSSQSILAAGPSRTDSPGWNTVTRQPKAVPDVFKPLVKILKRQRVEGITQLVFSQVGALISQEMPTSIVYEKAGVTKLKEYIALAEAEQIIRLKKEYGGMGDINVDVTISLHPRLCK